MIPVFYLPSLEAKWVRHIVHLAKNNIHVRNFLKDNKTIGQSIPQHILYDKSVIADGHSGGSLGFSLKYARQVVQKKIKIGVITEKKANDSYRKHLSTEWKL